MANQMAIWKARFSGPTDTVYTSTNMSWKVVKKRGGPYSSSPACGGRSCSPGKSCAQQRQRGTLPSSSALSSVRAS